MSDSASRLMATDGISVTPIMADGRLKTGNVRMRLQRNVVVILSRSGCVHMCVLILSLIRVVLVPLCESLSTNLVQGMFRCVTLS